MKVGGISHLDEPPRQWYCLRKEAGQISICGSDVGGLTWRRMFADEELSPSIGWSRLTRVASNQDNVVNAASNPRISTEQQVAQESNGRHDGC